MLFRLFALVTLADEHDVFVSFRERLEAVVELVPDCVVLQVVALFDKLLTVRGVEVLAVLRQ